MFAENIVDAWDNEERHQGFLCQDIRKILREVTCEELFWRLVYVTAFYPRMRRIHKWSELAWKLAIPYRFIQSCTDQQDCIGGLLGYNLRKVLPRPVL